jgi:Coenzyme PQQ synthesis protein D (PqqD)
VRPHPDVAAQRVQDEVVLVNLTTNAIYTLNRTGARAWELLEEGRSPSEIESALGEEFGVSRDDVASELHRLLDELLEKDLVQPL